MRIIIWILSLYPRQWRERYQDEMLALLEQHSITWKTSFDLLLGALDARLDPAYHSKKEFLFQRWHDRKFLAYIYISAFAVSLIAINCWSLSFALLNAIHANVYNLSLSITTAIGHTLTIYLLFIPLLISTISNLKIGVKKRSTSIILYALICLGCSIISMYPLMNYGISLPQIVPSVLIISILAGMSEFMALFTIGVKGMKQLKAHQRMPIFCALVIGLVIPFASTLYQYMFISSNSSFLQLLAWAPYEAIPYLSIAALVLILADMQLHKQGWRVMQGMEIVIALYTVIVSVVITIWDYNFLIAGSTLIDIFQRGFTFSYGGLIINTLVLISMLGLILLVLIRTFIVVPQQERKAIVMEQMTKY